MAYETDGSAANTTATSEGHVRSLPLCSGYLKPDAPEDGVHLQRCVFPKQLQFLGRFWNGAIF